MLTMEEALKQSNKRFAAGEIVKGTVIEVRPKEVLVDIGYKSEGSVPASEFEDIKTVKIGDEVDVLIEKLEDKDGMVVLSKEKAEFKKNWDKILTICNEGGTIAGKVKAVVKGGLLVNIGVEAFLPASQIDIPVDIRLGPKTGLDGGINLTIKGRTNLDDLFGGNELIGEGFIQVDQTFLPVKF
jgi:small subunit ribosomal protein S1